MSDKEFKLEPYPKDDFKLEPPPPDTPTSDNDEYDAETLRLLDEAEREQDFPWRVPKEESPRKLQSPWATPVKKKKG